MLSETDLIVLDEWELAPMTDQDRRDVLEVLEDFHGATSTRSVTTRVSHAQFEVYEQTSAVRRAPGSTGVGVDRAARWSCSAPRRQEW